MLDKHGQFAVEITSLKLLLWVFLQHDFGQDPEAFRRSLTRKA